MEPTLQSDVLDRLEKESGLSESARDLVLSAILGEVEECLGGKPPSKPEAAPAETRKPVRAFVGSLAVEGFRGIGRKAELSLTPGPGLTLVVGRNGSGKSSFAEALELLLTGDNKRWSGRTRIWKEGWRNLHKSDRAAIEATLLIDGKPGKTVVTRSWNGTESLEAGTASPALDDLSWAEPLSVYRPFLSYNELGSMLEEGPSKLSDALASILGLEDLVAAADALKEVRSTRTAAHKEVTDKLKAILASLAQHPDERARQCLDALSGKKWNLEVVEKLIPQHSDRMETTVPGVFVAGEVAGSAGATIAAEQGRVAGIAAASFLGHLSEDEARRRMTPIHKRLSKLQRARSGLDKLSTLREGLLQLITPDTIVCRCEEITASAINESIADGSGSLRTVKARTRAGMGHCQGRMCSPTIASLIARERGIAVEQTGLPSIRPPVKPLPLTDLL